MLLSRRHLLASSLMGAASLARQTPVVSARHTFAIENDHFVLDGKPFQIISGEMHYPRVPRSCWRDRLRKARALGLNTICTYVFWNAHEPHPGEFDFSGNLDVAAYIRMAQEEGLWVILRPGPYVCAEWDLGGLPSWLLANGDIPVRTKDPRYLQPAAHYLKRVGQELASLQITHGGPIILCQVENEYGSFGENHEYMEAVHQLILASGFDVTLYTADGSAFLKRGALPGVAAVINFGATDNVAEEFARLDTFRPSGPRMCGEFWEGWFDHWGETHQTVSVKAAVDGVNWMLSRGISVNIYMFHGGTSFGFTAGANQTNDRDHTYQPDISSYDYDALLDEAGRPTPKFFAVQEVIRRYLPANQQVPTLPPAQPSLAIPRFEFKDRAGLWTLLGPKQTSDHPKPMEALGQAYGLVLYRTKVPQAYAGVLAVHGVADYAIVFADEQRIGTLDRRMQESTLTVNLAAGQTLGILIDAMGRVNYGPTLGQDRKGLTGDVLLANQPLLQWENYPIPLNNLSQLKFTSAEVTGPAFYRAAVKLEQPADTFLDARGWGKGYVWVNGHNLGRFWSAGPQRSLFVPAEWLTSGPNEIIVLDIEQSGTHSMEGHKFPIQDIAGLS